MVERERERVCVCAPSLIQRLRLDALSNISPHVELGSEMRVGLDTQTQTQPHRNFQRSRPCAVGR